MGVAEELADVWRDVPEKPKTGKEGEYFALLLRLTLDSKKRVEETGRRYATLPTLRDLIRKRIVRVPAEHVKWLEVSAFDLVANPLKKSLASYVSFFSSLDVPLVRWFVHAAKKDSSLALDVKALEAWLQTQLPKEEPKLPESENPAAPPSNPSSPDAFPDPTSNSDPSVSEKPGSEQGGDVAPDRVFESS